MIYQLRYDERVQAQFERIRTWFDDTRGPGVGTEVVIDLVRRCRGLQEFPHRGTPRDDLRRGLRTMAHRRAFTIGYMVDGETITILGVIGRGQQLGELVGSPS